jgi:hypothetical protein
VEIGVVRQLGLSEGAVTKEGSISERSTVVAAADQVSADLGGDAVILELNRGIYFGLDAVGARIWRLIQHPTTVSQIKQTIADEYDVAPPECLKDIIGLLEQMSAHGLVEVT